MAESGLPYLKVLSKAGAVFQTGPAVVVTSEPYQYTSLKAGQFRMLSIFLEPVTGFLTCNLDVRDLTSSRRAYRAISYCWGNHIPTNRLLCSNGQSLLITKSAAEILEFIVPQNPTEFFWIDQLCINQADLPERSAQVSIMAQIYSSTKQVIAWLGRGDKSSESAVTFVETLFGEIEDMERKNRNPTLVPLMSLSANIHNIPVQMQASRRWKTLGQLLSNRWFERMWVMQEVIMACAETSHTAGVDISILLSFEKCAIDFNKLAKVLSILKSDHLDSNLVESQSEVDPYGNMILPPGLWAIQTFSTFRQLRIQGNGVPLNLALKDGWHFKASDDRDKVYAVMAFADEAANTSLPDYDSTVEDVYISRAAALLGREDDYPMLLHMTGVGLQRSYPTLPSWVPDFSSGSTMVNLKSVIATATRGGRYDASGPNEKTEIKVDLPSLALRLQAIQIDIIENVFRQPLFSENNDRWYDKLKPSRFLFPRKEYHKTMIQWLENIESFLGSPPPILGSSEPKPKDILWQTIVGDYPTSSALIDSPRLSQAFEDWYKDHRLSAGKFISSLLDSYLHTPDVYERVQLFEDMKNASLSTQPVFGTEQKRLLGYGPEGLLPGDTVCIIKGALIPFLLRPDTDTVRSGEQSGKRWRLVGGCFVHGLMYREGLSMRETEEFVIT